MIVSFCSMDVANLFRRWPSMWMISLIQWRTSATRQVEHSRSFQCWFSRPLSRGHCRGWNRSHSRPRAWPMVYDNLIVPMIRRMINLEDLQLYLTLYRRRWSMHGCWCNCLITFWIICHNYEGLHFIFRALDRRAPVHWRVRNRVIYKSIYKFRFITILTFGRQVKIVINFYPIYKSSPHL